MSNRKNPESVFSDDMWDRVGTNPDGSHYVYVNRVKVPLPDPKPTKSAAHQKIRLITQSDLDDIYRDYQANKQRKHCAPRVVNSKVI